MRITVVLFHCGFRQILLNFSILKEVSSFFEPLWFCILCWSILICDCGLIVVLNASIYLCVFFSFLSYLVLVIIITANYKLFHTFEGIQAIAFTLFHCFLILKHWVVTYIYLFVFACETCSSPHRLYPCISLGPWRPNFSLFESASRKIGVQVSKLERISTDREIEIWVKSPLSIQNCILLFWV